MLNTDDLRHYTGIGTGYTPEAMMARAADEIDRLRATGAGQVMILGKAMEALPIFRALVSDLAEYQTAVEFSWRDANVALGGGEIMGAEDLLQVLERIRVTTDSAMLAVRHAEEIRRSQADAFRVRIALAKCPAPTAGCGDGTAMTCVEQGECGCSVGEAYQTAADQSGNHVSRPR